jgi:hypothetical protein
MTQANHRFPDGFKHEDCLPEFAKQVKDRTGAVHWKSDSARPLKCGESCIGRPLASQTQLLDRPNLREAMLYGHLDFIIDSTIDRGLTYGIEVHVQCKADNGARQGNIRVNVLVGDPVLSDPGIAESVIDFALLPLNLSSRIESYIRGQLGSLPGRTIDGDPCRSIGVSRGTTALFDAIPFDAPARLGRPDRGAAVAGRGDRLRLELLSITRKPLPQTVSAGNAQLGNAAAGDFTAYLNGVAVAIPVPLGSNADGLVLPPSGGTVALNLCKTIALDGAEQVQLLFGNGLGGNVWSQFTRDESFGAGVPRRMTTARDIVMAAPSGAPDPQTGSSRPGRPQTVVLREFELFYRLVVLPGPGISVDHGRPARPGHADSFAGVPDTLAVDPDARPATPCREV